MNTLISILCMISFCFLLPLGDVLITILREQDMNPLYLKFVRSIIIVLLFLPWFGVKKRLHITKEVGWKILFQSLCLFGSITLWFWLLKHIQLAQLYAVGFLAPIFASIIAVIYLKEPFSKHKLLGVVGGFLGTLIVVRPGISDISPLIWVAVCCAILWAAAMVTARSLADEKNPFKFPYIQNIVFLVLTIPAGVVYWEPVSINEFIIIAVSALIHFASFYLLFKAYKHASVTYLAPFEFSSLIFSVWLGQLVFGQNVTIWTLIGGGVIFISAIYSSIIESKTQ